MSISRNRCPPLVRGFKLAAASPVKSTPLTESEVEGPELKAMAKSSSSCLQYRGLLGSVSLDGLTEEGGAVHKRRMQCTREECSAQENNAVHSERPAKL